MPQKKNPDVFELTRAKAAKVDSNLFLVKSIVTKLQSGYNRDLQLTKEPLIDSFETTSSTLKIFQIIIKKIKINEGKCLRACTPELFATEHAYELVKKGMPFREAYKEAAKNIGKTKINPTANIKSKKHIGATGNLGLENLKETIKDFSRKIDSEFKKFKEKLELLIR